MATFTVHDNHGSLFEAKNDLLRYSYEILNQPSLRIKDFEGRVDFKNLATILSVALDPKTITL